MNKEVCKHPLGSCEATKSAKRDFVNGADVNCL